MKRKAVKTEKQIRGNGMTFLGVMIPHEDYEFMAASVTRRGVISHQTRVAIREYVEREEAKS